MDVFLKGFCEASYTIIIFGDAPPQTSERPGKKD
jgi:hypothetical protein